MELGINHDKHSTIAVEGNYKTQPDLSYSVTALGHSTSIDSVDWAIPAAISCNSELTDLLETVSRAAVCRGCSHAK